MMRDARSRVGLSAGSEGPRLDDMTAVRPGYDCGRGPIETFACSCPWS